MRCMNVHATVKMTRLFCVGLVLCSCSKNAVETPMTAVFIDRSHIAAEDIPSVFDSAAVKYNTVSILNWKDTYPYLPKVDFAVAHNGNNLLIHYRVTEKRTIGTMENDLESVYKESCCEFFFMEESDSLYYNIESNCIGSIYLECGTERANRTVSTLDNLEKIDRWASLGRNSVGHIDSLTHWELAISVPLQALWRHDFVTLSGKTLLANVYNCVGSGDDRQYVTWVPVETDKPDFHRPEFFQPIYFE